MIRQKKMSDKSLRRRLLKTDRMWKQFCLDCMEIADERRRNPELRNHVEHHKRFQKWYKKNRDTEELLSEITGISRCDIRTLQALERLRGCTFEEDYDPAIYAQMSEYEIGRI